MTVCIAAICHNGTSIVAASDNKLSTQDFSGEAVIKAYSLGDNWGAMWSADDLSPIVPIISNARKRIADLSENTLEGVADAFAAAFQEQRKKEAYAQYLACLGITMEQFSNNATNIPQDSWADINEQISAVRLGCQFLVFGYDSDKVPHLFTVADPGVVRFDDIAGFAAIGSGWYRAMSSLFFFPEIKRFVLPEALYHVCSAKFMAETAEGVGESTFAFVYSGGENGYTPILKRAMDAIREIWSEFGKPRVPHTLDQAMFQLIKVNKKDIDEMFKREAIDKEKPPKRSKTKTRYAK